MGIWRTHSRLKSPGPNGGKELERQIQYNEYRSRKYNVLIYGVPKSEDEDTDLTVRSVLKEKLKMSKEFVDALMIANTHRIPNTG